MIRVLIADDSPTQRLLLREIVESDPGLAVAGEAADGLAAVELCGRLAPDVVLMDVDMPRLDGLAATRAIMGGVPRPIIVLLGSSASGVDREARALEAGAVAATPKPRGFSEDSPDAGRLLALVKAFAGLKLVRRHMARPLSPAPPAPVPARERERPPVEMVVLGASTGGPPVLQTILKTLPPDFCPVVLVQHISPGFIRGMAKWLTDTTSLSVEVAEKPMRILPGRVYLAPDSRHLLVEPGRVVPVEGEPVDGHLPGITVLFESAARAYGPRAAGILLTGMGRDGARGLASLARGSALTICQDRDSCAVWGMPKAALALDARHEVLSPPEIGRRLCSLQAEVKK
ncbi:MAG: response regulator [Proteobacteria bacterium]|nr:response regulator [Pseudomonadota bacterium]